MFCENHEMNENVSNDSLPPTEDHKVPAKRQKCNTIDSPNLNPSSNQSPRVSEWERTCLTKELRAYHTRLSNTVATATQLREMRKEMDKAFVEKAGMLEVQARMERETLKHLQVRLDTINGDESKATVKAEMSSVKIRIREQIESLLTENVRLNEHAMPLSSEKPPTLSKHEENNPQPADSMEMKMEQILAKDITPQETNLQCPESKQDNIQTQKSKSVSPRTVVIEKDKALLMARTKELEEQLQSAKSIISSLHEAVKEKSLLEKTVTTMRKKLQVAERVEQVGGHGTCNESSSSKSHSEDPEADKAKQSQQHLQLKVADYYILVSHSKFFEIEWEKYYQRIKGSKFVCTKCPAVRTSRPHIEDHVWVQHCGGSFKCPHCPDHAHLLLCRHSIGTHMKKLHPNECSSNK